MDHFSNFGMQKPRRRPTLPSEVRSRIVKPGAVYINSNGAYIVDGTSTPSEESIDADYEHDPRDIRLPNHTETVSHVAIDIGGSLVKLVYYSRAPHELGGRLNFLKFETDKIDACIEFMRQLQNDFQRHDKSDPREFRVMATGGGAFKYYDRIREALKVEVSREDEMDCLITGLDFFISEIPTEVFTYSESDPMHFLEPSSDLYPYLLVNIGSGVSIVKVSGPKHFERIGGTSLGGGTLWGLLSLLTGARTFDEMLQLAEKGDNRNVDMLVGDIYGMDYGKVRLKSSTIASSFGKVFKMKREAERNAEDHAMLANGDDRYHWNDNGINNGDQKDHTNHEHQENNNNDLNEFRPEDISRSLLYAISNNIGQIAYLHAQNQSYQHDEKPLKSIYFGGSFIRGHHQTMNTLSYAIKYWSSGSKQAYFLRHEGFLGAVGAFLKGQPRNWGRGGSGGAGGEWGQREEF